MSARSNRVHFWPFDGCDVLDEKSVIAEVYPSIFRNGILVRKGTPTSRMLVPFFVD